jgi:hypothetical protein
MGYKTARGQKFCEGFLKNIKIGRTLPSSGQPGFPLSVAGGAPVIFIRLGEQVCPGRRVLNPLRRQACFLRLQAPVIGMAQKFGHCATSWSSLPVENSSKFLKLFREFGNSQKFCALQNFARGLP